MTRPLWEPSSQEIEESNIKRFIVKANERYSLHIKDYRDLDAWSVEYTEDFWSLVWDFTGVIGDRTDAMLVNRDRMPGAHWFPDARLNFAENLLRRRDAAPALIFWGENVVKREISHAELYNKVSRLAQALRASGVEPGDCVVSFLPNIPEAVVGMLATASIGAIWSSCSPDFGVQGVIDRFGQIKPKVLLAVDGYYFNGKTINCLPVEIIPVHSEEYFRFYLSKSVNNALHAEIRRTGRPNRTNTRRGEHSDYRFRNIWEKADNTIARLHARSS